MSRNLRPISSSKIYEKISAGMSEPIKNKIGSLLSKGEQITTHNCEELGLSLPSRLSPFYTNIKALVNAGVIDIRYDKINNLSRVVYCIPYLTTKNENKILVNGTTFFTEKEEVNEKGEISKVYSPISLDKMAELLNMVYTVLVASYTADGINNNHDLKSKMLLMYGEMFCASLSRIPSIKMGSASSEMATEIKYLCYNFVQSGMFDKELTESDKSLSVKLSNIEPHNLEIINTKEKTTKGQYTDIDSFLSFLETVYPVALKGLNVTALSRTFTILYGAMSTLAIDYLPYLAALVSSETTGSKLLTTNFKKSTDKIVKMYGLKMLSTVNNSH